MIDPAKLAAFDQAAQTLGEILPPLWHSLYRGCLLAGFDKEQAIRLVEEYIAASTREMGGE